MRTGPRNSFAALAFAACAVMAGCAGYSEPQESPASAGSMPNDLATLSVGSPIIG